MKKQQFKLDAIDRKYSDLLNAILLSGFEYEDPNRKGVKRFQIPHYDVNVFRLHSPIISVRKSYFKGAVGELLLFLKGITDIESFHEYGVKFWDKDFENWKLKKGEDTKDLGKIYGYQYAKQYDVFDKFKKNKFRTDLIVNSWQVDDIKDMALPPCHFCFELIPTRGGFQIHWQQRSTDALLGLPMNILFYNLMGLLLEKWSGYKFEHIYGNLKNVHLYDNQLDLANKIVNINRLYDNLPEYLMNIDDQPKIIIHNDNWNTDLPFKEFIKTVKLSDFELVNYNPILNETVPMLAYR